MRMNMACDLSKFALDFFTKKAFLTLWKKPCLKEDGLVIVVLHICHAKQSTGVVTTRKMTCSLKLRDTHHHDEHVNGCWRPLSHIFSRSEYMSEQC